MDVHLKIDIRLKIDIHLKIDVHHKINIHPTILSGAYAALKAAIAPRRSTNQIYLSVNYPSAKLSVSKLFDDKPVSRQTIRQQPL
jgi:hypothetical protein